MLRFSLRQLECFVAAADAGTLAGGAVRCDASASAVSMSIAELEKRLGVQLLIRQHAKGVFLTEAGHRVLADARSLLDQADDLLARASADGSEVGGDLTVGCFTTLAPFFIPPLLDEFSARFRRVNLSIVEGSRDHLHHALVSGRAECAVLYDQGLPDRLDYTVIRTCRPYVCVAANHRLAGRATVRLEELADEPLIALDVAPSLQNAKDLLESAGLKPAVAHRGSNIEMVRSLVARGLGYGLLVQPWPTEVSYEGRPLATVEIADDIVEHRVVVAWPEGVRLTRRARAFVKFCLDRLK